MRKIIVNADDLGRGYDRNRAIIESFNEKLISSAGLIITNKYTSDAIKLIKENNLLAKIHLHFNLSTCFESEIYDNKPINNEFINSNYCSNGFLKVYKGTQQKLSLIKNWKIVYKELVSQYKKFIQVTEGKANYNHIDFHLWYNLSWPVAIALNLFTINYKIKTVRFIGLHHKGKRNKIAKLLSWNPFVNDIPSTNIDFFINNFSLFKKLNIIELYCHPNYKNGVLLDDSPSYIGHSRQDLRSHIQKLNETTEYTLISWKDMHEY